MQMSLQKMLIMAARLFAKFPNSSLNVVVPRSRPNCLVTFHKHHLLGVVAYTSIHVQDMISDEPDQVGEIWHSRLVNDELQHGLLFRSVHVEGQGSNRDADHALAMVEELDGFRVEGEIVGVLSEEKNRHILQ